MPIDKKKLAALAGSVKPPKGRRFGIESAAAKKPKKEEPAPDVLEEGDADDEGLGEDEEGDPSQVVPFLEQYAEEVQNCIDEVDQDTLIDPEMALTPENVQILQDGALMLPPRLQRLLPNLINISFEDAATIAAALVERDKYEDAETLAGWIFRIGQMLSGDFEEAEGDDPAGEEEMEGEA